MILWFLTAALMAQAHEYIRPTNVSDLLDYYKEDVTYEDARKVKDAQVAWADFDLIRRDFAFLKDKTNQEIEVWLLDNFALAGSLQKQLDNVRNSEIPTTSETKPAFRPRGWVRSAVVQASHPNTGVSVPGMVDVKGLGHGSLSYDVVKEQSYKANRKDLKEFSIDKLRTKDHSDGLMSLGEAIAEVTRQRAAQMLFDIKGLLLETVENYAIISLPFRILKENDKSIPAGLVLRQAHFGRDNYLEVPERIYIDDVGRLQHTASKAAIDFGGVIITAPELHDRFLGRPLSIDGERLDPQSSLPWKYGHETADAFVAGAKNAVYEHVETMLKPLKALQIGNGKLKRKQQRRSLLIKQREAQQQAGWSLSNSIESLKPRHRVKLDFSDHKSFDLSKIYRDLTRGSPLEKHSAEGAIGLLSPMEQRMLLEMVDWGQIDVFTAKILLRAAPAVLRNGYFSMFITPLKIPALSHTVMALVHEYYQGTDRTNDAQVVDMVLKEMEKGENTAIRFAAFVESREVDNRILSLLESNPTAFATAARKNLTEAIPVILKSLRKAPVINQIVFGYSKCHCLPPIQVIRALIDIDSIMAKRLLRLRTDSEGQTLARKWFDKWQGGRTEYDKIKASIYALTAENCAAKLDAHTKAATASAGGAP